MYGICIICKYGSANASSVPVRSSMLALWVCPICPGFSATRMLSLKSVKESAHLAELASCSRSALPSNINHHTPGTRVHSDLLTIGPRPLLFGIASLFRFLSENSDKKDPGLAPTNRTASSPSSQPRLTLLFPSSIETIGAKAPRQNAPKLESHINITLKQALPTSRFHSCPGITPPPPFRPPGRYLVCGAQLTVTINQLQRNIHNSVRKGTASF
ncbi:hypothetical protein BGX38DRAFT_629053 [Terfezia claveryi]|nr:hypothetical protein BGX38DRAFT_629053 [Terfezia claveryi]